MPTTRSRQAGGGKGEGTKYANEAIAREGEATPQDGKKSRYADVTQARSCLRPSSLQHTTLTAFDNHIA